MCYTDSQQDFSVHAYKVGFFPVAFDGENCAATAVLSDSAVPSYSNVSIEAGNIFLLVAAPDIRRDLYDLA